MKLGDKLIDDDEFEGWREVDTIIFQRTEGGYTVEIENDRGVSQLYEPGERVKRPAPNVLDADGVEVELGDDLYNVESGKKLHVGAIDTRNGKIATAEMFAIDEWADPAMYAHERRDSWELWRKEWNKPPFDYCKLILGIEYDHETQLSEVLDAQGEDLERRAKKLAERGQ